MNTPIIVAREKGATRSFAKGIKIELWINSQYWRDLEDSETYPNTIIFRNENETGRTSH